MFTFDSKKCTANVEKCVAFWRKIDEIGLQPIDCSLYKPKRQESGSVTEEQFSEDETSEDFSKKEERKRLEDIQISWCDALKELQKRKLDRVAVYLTQLKFFLVFNFLFSEMRKANALRNVRSSAL